LTNNFLYIGRFLNEQIRLALCPFVTIVARLYFIKYCLWGAKPSEPLPDVTVTNRSYFARLAADRAAANRGGLMVACRGVAGDVDG
jgi:hypothetical protein